MTKEKRSTIGRPSKYNDELQDRADAYVYDYKKQGDVIPSNSGLCVWLGISRSTLHDWSTKFDAFSSTLDKIQSVQETVTLNKSLIGEFNSTISKLVLANHGYSDRQELDHRSGDGSMTPPSKIEYTIVDVEKD